MKLKILQLLNYIQTSFWAAPMIGLLVAIILAVVNLSLDTLLFSDQQTTHWLLNITNLDSVQTLFSTTAGAIIGVLGITFSITITTLVLATQQFGPHILRTFLERTVVKCILAVFSGTSVYCVLGLFFSSTYETSNISPTITVLTLLVLVIANIIMLIVFIQQTSRAIQVESIASQIMDNYFRRSSALFTNRTPKHTMLTSRPAYINHYLSTTNGYIQRIDYTRLAHAAVQNNTVMRVNVQPGDHVVFGSLLLSSTTNTDMNMDIYKFFKIGQIATPAQDIRYPIQQLVEIALRALSPGINDPFTATICINRLCAIVVHTSALDLTAPTALNTQQQSNIICTHMNIDDIIKLCFNQIRLAGGTRNDIGRTLLSTYKTINQSTHGYTKLSISNQLILLREQLMHELQLTERKQLITDIDDTMSELKDSNL